MIPKAGELYFLDHPSYRLGKSKYGRFILVVRVDLKRREAEIVYGSTKTELAGPQDIILRKQDNPEFLASGLKDSTCFLPDSKMIPLSLLTAKKGEAVGLVRQELEEWWGDKFV